MEIRLLYSTLISFSTDFIYYILSRCHALSTATLIADTCNSKRRYLRWPTQIPAIANADTCV